MGLLDWILGKRTASSAKDGANIRLPAQRSASEDHSVIISIPLTGDPSLIDGVGLEDGVFEEELSSAIQAAGVGRLDGHGQGGGTFEIFCDGPDADRLFDAMIPVLEKRPFPKGSYALKRYGTSDSSREERVNLEWEG
jgi:hypothetical protein